MRSMRRQTRNSKNGRETTAVLHYCSFVFEQGDEVRHPPRVHTRRLRLGKGNRSCRHGCGRAGETRRADRKTILREKLLLISDHRRIANHFIKKTLHEFSTSTRRFKSNEQIAIPHRHKCKSHDPTVMQMPPREREDQTRPTSTAPPSD